MTKRKPMDENWNEKNKGDQIMRFYNMDEIMDENDDHPYSSI
jgi:hypothetical protein